MINPAELELLHNALAKLAEGYEHLPDFTPDFDVDAAAEVLQTVAKRMQDNYPYYHPQYAGQMLKPPHAVARIAYAMSLGLIPIIMRLTVAKRVLHSRKNASSTSDECTAGMRRSVT